MIMEPFLGLVCGLVLSFSGIGLRLIGSGHDPSRDAEEPGIGGDALQSTGSIGPIHLMSRTFLDVKMERKFQFTYEHDFEERRTAQGLIPYSPGDQADDSAED